MSKRLSTEQVTRIRLHSVCLLLRLWWAQLPVEEQPCICGNHKPRRKGKEKRK